MCNHQLCFTVSLTGGCYSEWSFNKRHFCIPDMFSCAAVHQKCHPLQLPGWVCQLYRGITHARDTGTGHRPPIGRAVSVKQRSASICRAWIACLNVPQQKHMRQTHGVWFCDVCRACLSPRIIKPRQSYLMNTTIDMRWHYRSPASRSDPSARPTYCVRTV